MVYLVIHILRCSVLIALAMHLAVDVRAIKEGFAGENGGLSSEAVKVEDLRSLDSVGVSLIKGDLVGWEMRSVPSGPDPLHHNGTPKKPQTP